METTTALKVKVTERALVARMTRKLATEGLQLKKCRFNSRWYNDFGDYYTVHIHLNTVEHRHINLETLVAWAREDGVLRGFEVLDQGDEK